MKRLLLFSLVGIVGLLGAGKAHAQLHNMGLQMSIVNPKGNDDAKKGFNSLYGGLFYEYRFTGADVDKNELRDHFGVEFGLNYTEFIKKGTMNVEGIGSNTSVRSSNKGANLYVAPKYYMTIYPDLVELYAMGKAGFQYLNCSGSIAPSNNYNNISSSALSKNSATFFVGASLGLEVKLGTVFVGANFGFDTNSIQRVIKDQEYKNPLFPGNANVKPFANLGNLWGNTVLEFKIKALLNAKD